MANKTQLRTREPESEYSKRANEQATATNTIPEAAEEESNKKNKQGDNPSPLKLNEDR
jgi:hypothetical protein